jgi:hypothetical protein
MATTHAAHGIRSISVEPITRYARTDGSEFFTSTLVVTTEQDTFRLDLFAASREALRVMQDDFASPRQMDEVTR